MDEQEKLCAAVDEFASAMKKRLLAFDAWLFCLGDEDYESKCKKVAEFYRYKDTGTPPPDPKTGAGVQH